MNLTKGETRQGSANASPISLSLDDYEDIFSDFDPRPFSERAISDDFLYELKRACLGREENGLGVVFLVPKEKRFAGQEARIKDRLRSHFKRHRQRLEERIIHERNTGFKMTALGVVFMFLATYILTYTNKNLWSTFVVVLLEPAGWFTMWEGMDLIFFRAREINPDLEFYRKMTGAKLSFVTVL
jgi:hypothetical protein